MKKDIDLKNKSGDELKNLSNEYRAELAKLRFRHTSGQLEKTAELKKVRKNIARVETFLRQKELAKVNNG